MKAIKNLSKKQKISILVAIVALILIAIICVVFFKKAPIQKLNLAKRAEAVNKNINYQVYQYSEEGKGKMLITFRDDENGIDTVEYVSENNVLTCNGKNQVAVDYDISDGEELEFKMHTTKGEDVVSKITINNEFVNEYGLNIENKYQNLKDCKLIDIEILQGLNNKYTKYYKIGENGDWQNYTDPVVLLDYNIVASNSYNTENNTITLYAKSVDEYKNEIIVNKTLEIDTANSTTSVSGDSLIDVVKQDNFSTGTYDVTVNSETYNVRSYVLEGNQTWTSNMVFGLEDDVATANDFAKRMVIVKVKGDLTIENNAKVTACNTTYGGPKGMLLYCTGTLTNNGQISMTARGAKAEGQEVYLYKNANQGYESVPAKGAAGGSALINQGPKTGNPGTNGENRSTGGGGSGNTNTGSSYNKTSGAGAYGTSYSGGSGGGGSSGYKTGGTAGNGAENGGAGGTGKCITASTNARTYIGEGGAGNPGGRSFTFRK